LSKLSFIALKESPEVEEYRIAFSVFIGSANNRQKLASWHAFLQA
jgi:hypothetical protein